MKTFIFSLFSLLALSSASQYFHNTQTNETQWEFPQGVDVKLFDKETQTHFYYDSETNSTSWDHPDYHEYFAGDHDHPFFVHKETQERSWTLPDDINWISHHEDL